MPIKKIITFLSLYLLVYALWQYQSIDTLQAITLAITMTTAVFWVTEWLPIPVSSLLPIALFPLTGIITPTEVAQAYGSPLIILLLGGFLLSSAMSHNNTHQYLAHQILTKIGTNSPKKIIFGFMLTAFLLSMWISNTATTLMLLPIAIAILSNSQDRFFATLLLLGIAYAASIGGTMTPIGTPPNLIMIENYQQGTANELGFLSWIKNVFPMVIIFFPLMVWLLTSQVKENTEFTSKIDKTTITSAQQRTLLVFAFTALLWVTRTAPFGGWKSWLDLPYANDASVALLGVVAMFMLSDNKGNKLLTWQTANTIPWGVLLLFSGGMVIAAAFKSTGLSALLADQLIFLKDLHLFVLILAICLLITFLTEITSNTATTAILMPVLMSAAQAMDVDPIKIMIPAAISASCAFMLPVATAPNAIVFGSERVAIKDMIKQGFKLNLCGAFIIAAVATWWL
ncbi:SLC13 family permease [Marinicella sp. S1101]|uniref:SLC13 family permease n=1 Tax=Marinicella marina TaxID=2996016 RepID=UPI0022610194|nr:SLC13 family permease [Marinicella marina]MCX7554780.1 SLC13 family permease [Marinicella marina]MDJ1140987.1 SLC13 family permease [Marinicella marina]